MPAGRNRSARILDEHSWLNALMDLSNSLIWQTCGHATQSPAWRIMPRELPDNLIYFVDSGQVVGRARGESIRLEADSLLWLPPRVPHEFSRPPRQGPPRLYFFRFRLIRAGRDLVVQGDVAIERNAGELRASLDVLHDELQTRLPHHETRIRASLALVFSWLFRRRHAPQETGPALHRAQRERLAQYLHDHIAERPTPAELAEELHLSADYFARIFRLTYGVPPRRWLVRERARQAAMWLEESGLSITEVAHKLGYPDVYLFSRQFKTIMGVSPRAFRQRSS